MPHQSLRKCTYPGCNALVTRGRCARHAAVMVRDPDVKRLYNSQRWLRMRVNQLASNPWCARCLEQGIHTPATEVHHQERHRGDERLFYTGQLQSLCKACHASETAQEVGWH